MTLKPAKTNATYQDVLDAPAHMRAELIDGDLYLQPRPSSAYQLAVVEILLQLRKGVRMPGVEVWMVLPEVELHIPTTLVPDLAAWRMERFTEDAESPRFAVVPDWVCEVLSPGTRAYDLGLKREIYLQRGVEWLWVVDPAEQVLEIFECNPERTHWELVGTWGEDDVLTQAHPFFVPLSLASFWRL